MAGENIGSWNVSLTANAGGMIRELERGATKIQSFSAMAVTATKTMATGVNSALVAVTGVNMGAATAQLQNMAGAALGVVAAIGTGGTVAIVGAVAAAAAAVVGFATASMDAVEVQVRLGRQIGITAQQAAGLQVLADRYNVSGDALSGGLNVWARQLGALRRELSSGHGGVISEGLHRLGIDATLFAGANVSEQFALIAEGSRRIGDGMERSAVLTDVLSRRAQEMIPLFRAQGSELRNLNGVAAEYGYSISQSQAEGIAAAVRQLKELSRYVGSVFSMIGQGAALIFAPAASAAGTMLRELVTKARPVINLLAAINFAFLIEIAAVITAIVAAVNFCMPAIVAFGKIIDVVASVVSTAFTIMAPVVTEAFAELGKAFSEFGGDGGVIETLMKLAVPLTIFFTMSIVTPIMVAVAVATMLVKAFAAVVGAAGRASRAIAEFHGGMAGRAAAMLGISLAGAPAIEAPPPPIAPAAVQSMHAATMFMRDLHEQMERTLKVDDPFEKWSTTIEGIRETMVNMSMVDMDPTQGYRALGAATQSFINSGQQQSRSPAAVMAGSVAEQRAIVQAQLQDRDSSRDPVEQVRQAIERQTEIARQQVEIGIQIRQAIEDGQLQSFGD
jgi:hypothetical protein